MSNDTFCAYKTAVKLRFCHVFGNQGLGRIQILFIFMKKGDTLNGFVGNQQVLMLDWC